MSAPAKRYNTNYKKRVDVERDTYLPRLSPKEIIQCSGCGAFYYRLHWTLTRPNGFNTPVHAHPVFCPACRKIRERFPSGELQLLGVEPVEKREIVHENFAKEKNRLVFDVALQFGIAPLRQQHRIRFEGLPQVPRQRRFPGLVLALGRALARERLRIVDSASRKRFWWRRFGFPIPFCSNWAGCCTRHAVSRAT